MHQLAVFKFRRNCYLTNFPSACRETGVDAVTTVFWELLLSWMRFSPLCCLLVSGSDNLYHQWLSTVRVSLLCCLAVPFFGPSAVFVVTLQWPWHTSPSSYWKKCSPPFETPMLLHCANGDFPSMSTLDTRINFCVCVKERITNHLTALVLV